MNARVATALLLALLMSGHLGVSSAQGGDDQAKREAVLSQYTRPAMP